MVWSSHIHHPQISWQPPATGELKFNVDGSAKGKPGLAGCGDILRNSELYVAHVNGDSYQPWNHWQIFNEIIDWVYQILFRPLVLNFPLPIHVQLYS
ncbi:Uncharacterized protein TCM_026934 [Theobroma cacao]|uniref:RNase H type-1 domain-containing protein n=1 Tax=Theobroma cacao TaxID=3641 RepID=A0A061G7I7_THECC|nr:Uncharacterized protein TCM_026934 [Theobroma cacao]